MVQRKESSKLMVQINHEKSEMKKTVSKSTTRTDTKGLRFSPSKPNISMPGKPPPPSIVDVPASPAKQSTGSPNYMKSTNSFNARTERTLVSPQITRFGSDSNKSPCQNNSRRSKTNSSLENKPATTLTRSTSSKLVTTPKKAPSFKQTRLSKVASCPDVKAQRATCSSTLKDSRFPAYLKLNPGENEVDGTSVMKVCSYTYCSLNGHFHYPLPPLKTFLSAKKRLLKSQKITEPEPANPLTNTSDDGISQLKMDGSMEVFIEIYAREKGDAAETIGSGIDGADEKEKDDSIKKMEYFDDLITQVGGVDEEEVKYDDEEDAGSLFDGSPHSEIDFEEIADPNSGTIFPRVDDTSKSFYEEFKEGEADEDYPAFFAHVEPTLEYIDNSSCEKGELHESDTETSDMKREEQFTVTYLDQEGDYKTQTECKINLDLTQLQKEGNPDSNLTADGNSNSCFEEIVVEEVHQEAFEEASTGFEESTTAEGNDRAAEKDEEDSYVISFTSGPNEEPSSEKYVICTVEDEIVSTFPQPEDDETNYSTVVTDEAFLIDHQEDKLQQIDDAHVLHGNQTIDQIYEHMSIEEYQIADIRNNNSTKEVVNDESLLLNIEEKETPSDVDTSYFGREQQCSQTGIEDAMEYSDELNQSKLMSDKFISDPSQSCSDAEQEDSVKEGTECCEVIQDCQHHANDENSELGQNVAHENILSITQEEALDRNLASYKDIENQNHSEKDHNEVETNSSSMNSEEQEHSDMQLSSLAEFSTQNFRHNEMEDNMSGAATETCLGAATETCLGANISPSEKARIGTFNDVININQEEPSTCNNLKLVITCKRPDTDEEESITFNPRDPNFLPINADPETEKVDLRHQMEDERKNAEEWMLDYALRQAVTKLSPARSRRVALLVEAFETVKPKPKYETHLRDSSASFSGVRPLQTCI